MRTCRFVICPLLILLAQRTHAQSQWQRLYPLPTQQGLAGATYANDLFVAVGDYDTILTSPDAVTWTARPTEGSAMLADVAYGNGQFIAVGTEYSAECEITTALRSSRDGLTWTEQPPLQST